MLTDFSQRLLEQSKEGILLDRIVERCISTGLLKGQNKQRTDSTRIIAKVRALHRIELAGETLRRTLDDLAQIAPAWLKEHLQADWGKGTADL